jgi:cyclophilin family peptidyl-prolyl cis-trans isomerase
MPSRSRDRHLAKLAERRRAERSAEIRRRRLLVGSVAGVIVLIAVVVGASKIFGKEATASPTPSASVTPSETVSPTPSAKPGHLTGTVKTAPAPSKVACDASTPPTASKPKPQFAGPLPMTIDAKKTYTATIETSCGTIVVRLDAKDVPVAVNNFVFLAEHHLYDGTWFHRILSTFVIQGGDPKGDGTGGPGYQFTTETNPTTKFADASGLFAYANSGPDTNGSQFFITLAKLPNLDPPNGPYTIFGTVTQGFDVVKTIAKVPTTANPSNPQEQSTPLQAVYVTSVTISVSK